VARQPVKCSIRNRYAKRENKECTDHVPRPVRTLVTDGQIAQVLILATTALFLLLNMFFVSMENSDEAREVRRMLQRFTDEFKGRFPASASAEPDGLNYSHN